MSFLQPDKPTVTQMFLQGKSVTDISAFYQCGRKQIEDILREAIVGLAKLNEQMNKRLSAELEKVV